MHDKLDPILVVQHALVTRSQAWQAGLSAHQIDSLLARQLLLPVHRGVFRDPAAPQTLEQRALAAVLAAGPGSVASHRMAIALRGMPNYRCLLSEVTAQGYRQIPGVFSHRAARTPEHSLVCGVPTASAARTIVDVSVLVNRLLLEKWISTWLSTKVLTLDELEAQMEALKHHTGVPIVRAALTSRTLLHGTADSPAEAMLGLLLESHGLPPLTLHHQVTTTSGLDFELDWSYPDWMVALEMDGYGVHMRSLEAFEHDRYRRNELEIDGWTILNFTKRQVERRSMVVVNQVRRIIAGRTLPSFPAHGG